MSAQHERHSTACYTDDKAKVFALGSGPAVEPIIGSLAGPGVFVEWRLTGGLNGERQVPVLDVESFTLSGLPERKDLG